MNKVEDVLKNVKRFYPYIKDTPIQALKHGVAEQ
jgi:hypothetical protein